VVLFALTAWSCGGTGTSPAEDFVAPLDQPDSTSDITPPQDNVLPDAHLGDDGGTDSLVEQFVCTPDIPELEGCAGSIQCNSEKLALISNDCVACLYQGIVACGLGYCPSFYVSSCYTDCIAEENPKLCILENCDHDQGLSCVLDARLAGLCANFFSGCGLPSLNPECAQCDQLNRTCVRGPDEISCGSCTAGTWEVEGSCVLPESCPEGACAPNGSCEEGSTGPDCVCDPGFAHSEAFLCTPAFTTNEWVEIVASDEEVTFWQGTDEVLSLSMNPASAPCHPVILEKGYSMMKYEVSVTEYAKCVEAGACPNLAQCTLGEPHDPFDQRLADHPVICASFNVAKSYCSWVGGRLPSESEWEYAASKADACAPLEFYPWGDGEISGTIANYKDAANPFQALDFPYTQNGGPTTPVGFFDGSLRTRASDQWMGGPEEFQTQDNASPFGIYDMSGNIAEWTLDCWNSDYTEKTTNDGSPWTDGNSDCSKRVKRGEAWSDVAQALTTHFRAPKSPSESSNFFGIRCVLELGPAQ
jgi:formylglycine-generating enzyme required for sulfatase activity